MSWLIDHCLHKITFSRSINVLPISVTPKSFLYHKILYILALSINDKTSTDQLNATSWKKQSINHCSHLAIFVVTFFLKIPSFTIIHLLTFKLFSLFSSKHLLTDRCCHEAVEPLNQNGPVPPTYTQWSIGLSRTNWNYACQNQSKRIAQTLHIHNPTTDKS